LQAEIPIRGKEVLIMAKADSKLTKELESLNKRIEVSKKNLRDAEVKAKKLKAAIKVEERVFLFTKKKRLDS
jgi:hypothetical protein